MQPGIPADTCRIKQNEGLSAIYGTTPYSGGYRGAGGPWRGEMVSAQYLRGARRRGGGMFWPVGQKIWAEGEMKTSIRH